MDEARKNELKADIRANKALKAKYERIRNSIEDNSLSTMVDLTALSELSTDCNTVITNIDSNAGYHYLNTMRDKLQADKDTIDDYRYFLASANASWVALYNFLGDKITALDAEIEADRSEYDASFAWHEKPLTWFDGL